MATSHYCNGKWRDGPVASCPKHKGLSKKQPSVYRTPDAGEAAADSGAGDSGDSAASSSSSGSAPPKD